MQEFPWSAARIRSQEIDQLRVTMIGKVLDAAVSDGFLMLAVEAREVLEAPGAVGLMLLVGA